MKQRIGIMAGLAVCALILLLCGLAAHLHSGIVQLRAVRALKARGAVVAFANRADPEGNEIRTWSWIEGWLLPREGYAEPYAVDLRNMGQVGLEELRLVVRLRSVRDVNLDGTNATDGDLAVLTELPNIRHISFRDTKITDASVPELKQMTTLGTLDISNSRISQDGRNELEKHLPNCAIGDFRDSWPNFQ